MQSWIDMTLRPAEEAQVAVQPDGTIELHWPIGRKSGGLTLLLTADQARRLVGRVLDAELTPAVPV